jgi:DNA-binding MarR family transcriptional regulator
MGSRNPAVDDDLPLLMVRTVKAMIAEMEAAAGGPNQAGLTVIHGIALRYIATHRECTSAQLASHLHITKQSASEIVQALEGEGVVERSPHPLDGRSRILGLTAKGESGLAVSRARWSGLVERWGSGLGASDLGVVRRALESYLEETEAQ